jgi:hypothetical protein
MTVYVDDARIPAQVGRINARWSHMMADSREELIEFAQKIGLKRPWLQNKPSGVHFDVTEYVRNRAIDAGAVEIKCRSEEWFRVARAAAQQYVGPGWGG